MVANANMVGSPHTNVWCAQSARNLPNLPETPAGNLFNLSEIALAGNLFNPPGTYSIFRKPLCVAPLDPLTLAWV